MNLPRLLLCTALGAIASSSFAGADALPVRPNIIFIEVDDLPYSYTSVWGSPTAQTPTLDRLAREGFVFDNAVCQGMMCGPSRNSLISGRYPHQLGFYQNGDMRKLPKDSWVLPKRLQESGYTTAWVGKSHLKPWFGTRKDRGADSFNDFFGFDYSIRTLGRALVGRATDGDDGGGKGEPNPYMDFLRDAGLLARYEADMKAGRNSTLPEDAYLDGWFAKHAVDYIECYQAKKPLFLWVNFSVPHGPYDVADPYHEPFRHARMPGLSEVDNFTHPESLIARTRRYSSPKRAIDDQRGLHANIAFMDRSVDRVLAALARKGLLENSWIIFFSDQGVMVGAHGLIHKSTLFRQITQPAMIIRPPGGLVQSRRLPQPVELMDLLPTTLELARATSSAPPAGVSLLPLFAGHAFARTHGFAEIEDWVMATDGRYRLIRSVKGEGLFLFDDLKDPENLHDLAASEPKQVAQLGAAIDDWLKRTGPRLPAKSQ